MTHSLSLAARLGFTVALAAVLAGCAGPGPKPPSPELQQRIEAAHTRADHEAIAVDYDKQAAGARSVAEEHRKLAKLYRGQSFGGRGGGNMSAHCNSVVSMYEGIAAEYDKMAAEHRQIAEKAER